MSTIHPTASSVANFSNTIRRFDSSSSAVLITTRFVMASQLTLFGDSTVSVNTKSTRRSYTREFKLGVVAHYRDNTLYATSKHFGLNTKTILRPGQDQEE